jgi:aspartyl-tRNA(Asn)/glutamyl-tRNA(Gln) amidotransferase subunit C
MARITVETVDAIARLAQLLLTDEERATFATQLEQILSYAESIQAIDAEGEEAAKPLGGAPLLREDEPRPGFEADRALAPAPDAAQGLFRVPRILP